MNENTKGKRIPIASYRLQFSKDFRLSDAAGLLDYLVQLGISDLYASPLFTATSTSTHGYDLCDHSRIHPTLGNRNDLTELAAQLALRHLGLLLDIVPNHMAADIANPWWADVLEHGPRSRYAHFFDIDWETPNSLLAGKILLPVLGDFYGNELESGRIKMGYASGAFFVTYVDKRYPVSLRTFSHLLRALAPRLKEDREKQLRIDSFAEAVDSCRRAAPNSADALNAVKNQFDTLSCSSQNVRSAVEDMLAVYNTIKSSVRLNTLHQLIQNQHYRLAYWRTGRDELNYRRFFDVTNLVCLRAELPDVFQHSHEFLMSLIRDGIVTGLRVDHPDGLRDPRQYFERLQSRSAPKNIGSVLNESEAPLGKRAPIHCYMVAEKILAGEEMLPIDWPVDGTTGYDFLNSVNGLFVDSGNRSLLEQTYQNFTGSNQNFSEVLYDCKKHVLSDLFYSDVQSLGRRLHQIALSTQFGQDLGLRYLTAALTELTACFPIYRTYVTETSQNLSEADRNAIVAAVREANQRNATDLGAGIAFCSRLLLLDSPRDLSPEMVKECRQFVMRFQQLTGPAMAKGLEDTAHYRHCPLLSLNEVGGSPDQFGERLKNFHSRNHHRVQDWPHSLLATATHDTKRGEDVRARINVLSEMPDEWRKVLNLWSTMNSGKKSAVNGRHAPSANDEIFFYQTVIGALPSDAVQNSLALHEFKKRLSDYMIKAVREAKLHTSWIQPDPTYESALLNFVEAALDEMSHNCESANFLRKIAFLGALNSLSQALLKLSCPGVPDFYQGTELWDLNLVDPDNRRPVDFTRRRRLLSGLQSRFKEVGATVLASELLTRIDTGEIKMFLIWRTLQFRNAHRALFDEGHYQPINILGCRSKNICAFARTRENEKLIVIAPRFFTGLTQGRMLWPPDKTVWNETALELPADWRVREWRNLLTDEHAAIESQKPVKPLHQFLSIFPAALLQLI